MIEIKAKRRAEGVDIHSQIEGKGEDIIKEAVAIMALIPKSIEKLSPLLYHKFMVALMESEPYVADEKITTGDES